MKEIESKGTKVSSIFTRVLSKIGRNSSGLLRTIGLVGSKVIKLIGIIGGIGLTIGQ